MAKFEPAERQRTTKTKDEAGPIRIVIQRSDAAGKENIVRYVSIKKATVSNVQKAIQDALFG